MTYIKDTIAARATAPGRGGIGIVRVSGQQVPDIATAVIGTLPEPRYASYCAFRDEHSAVIDEGIALYFRAPDSFTGEDVLELQGHGGPVVLDMLLNRVVSLGARVARPGEFSKRAFLNDKIDLAQAEAIADLIASTTSEAARGAMRSLQGEFSRMVDGLALRMIELRMYVEAAIDFPEEEIDFISDERVSQQLAALVEELELIESRAGDGALLNDGASVVLLGKPNAGKSSLMNLLTGRDTSIVTEIPGTTRDLLNQDLQLDGIPLTLVDTAGLRDSADAIEAEGVKRAMAAGDAADLVIHVIDASVDKAVPESTDPRQINVLNKIDLLDSTVTAPGMIRMSAKTGEGLDQLKAALKEKLGYSGNTESGFTARTRHVTALKIALAALRAGESALRDDQAGELLAEELKVAHAALSEITGEFTSDDLLGEIFSRFCIGK